MHVVHVVVRVCNTPLPRLGPSILTLTSHQFASLLLLRSGRQMLTKNMGKWTSFTKPGPALELGLCRVAAAYQPVQWLGQWVGAGQVVRELERREMVLRPPTTTFNLALSRLFVCVGEPHT